MLRVLPEKGKLAFALGFKQLLCVTTPKTTYVPRMSGSAVVILYAATASASNAVPEPLLRAQTKTK
jgi:hypothetical protein